MKKKRVKYNYEFIIHDWDLDGDFEKYCKLHSDKVHSKRRLAHSFLSGLRIYYKKPCYIVGEEEPFLIWISRQVKRGEIKVVE